MTRYIEVTRSGEAGEARKVLVNVTRILNVAEADGERCRIYLQGYSFGVRESYAEVRDLLLAAEKY